MDKRRLTGFSLICSMLLLVGCGPTGATGRSADVANAVGIETAANGVNARGGRDPGDFRTLVVDTPNYLEVTRSFYVPSYREVLVYVRGVDEKTAHGRNQENILDIRSVDGIVNFATCQYPTKDVRRVRVVFSDNREVMNVPVSADVGNPRTENTNMNRPVAATTLATVESTYATPVSGWVSYHSGPSLSSPVVGRMRSGQRAPIVGQYNAYWYRIQVNGRVAYITTNTKYIQVVDGGGPSAPPANTESTPPNTGTGTLTGGGGNGGAATGGGVSTGGGVGSGAGAVSTVASTGIPIPPPGVRLDTNIRPIAGPSASPTAKFNAVLQVAESKLGTPYVWGHNEDRGQTGFDCSNFTEYVYHHALGYSFSTASRTQYSSVGVQGPVSSLRQGDLLCFNQGGHSGIYIGNGRMIQCGGGAAKVAYLPMSPGSYWYTHLSAVKHMF